MIQEEKDLLIKDLCYRLPYGVKVHAKYTDLGETIEVDGIVKMIDVDGLVSIEIMYDTSSAWTCVEIDNVKPYLFPLSSMTEEQTEELLNLINTGQNDNNEFMRSLCRIEFYHKHHFDYNGLIPMGLAIDASELKVKCKLMESHPNNHRITIGTKIRSKANPDIILSIISNDCHEDEFECSNGSVLSLKQIEKYYEII